MTLEEYNKELKELRSGFELQEKQLRKKCALTNNTIKVGDIISDNIGSIIVETIGIYYYPLSGMPHCFYNGIILNKDGKPNKRGDKRSVQQDQMI